MPYTSRDASSKTKKANTPRKKKQWAAVARSSMRRGDSEATAIRKANGVLKRGSGRRKKTRR